MTWFRSFRSLLLAVFLPLGLIAIAVTGWEASASAAQALRHATEDRLVSIGQTRGYQIERYFEDVSNHVLALSTDESTWAALDGFRAGFRALTPVRRDSPDAEKLRAFYRGLAAENLFPDDPRTQALQLLYLAANPHPVSMMDQLLDAPGAGAYGDVHRRFHPTLHRYLNAFGFYDIFLLDTDGRVLYTVSKETDFGVSLRENPRFRSTGLSRAFERAMTVADREHTVLEDYSLYVASHDAPAAFIAAPIWRAGEKAGVLAIQVSIDEVDRVMAGDRHWKQEGLGVTGQAYLLGRDGLLRSNLRREVEGQAFARRLGILRKPEESRVPMLRTSSPVNTPGIGWRVVAEIAEQEALAPVRDLQRRILYYAGAVAVVFGIAAYALGGSVSSRLRQLAENVRRIAGRDFRARVEEHGRDEVARLAGDFNRMAAELEKTTVSKDELQVLAGQLITAQEDERRRVARELHDDLTQRLAALAIEAGQLEQRLPVGEARAAMARLRSQIGPLSMDVQGLSRRLHPALLEELGLVAALEAEGRDSFERGGPPVELHCEGAFDDVDREEQLALYRIAQESLRNIRRHAAAEQVVIRLSRHPNAVSLTVEDDGRGFERGSAGWKPGVGLASMEERARLLGGTLTIESKPGQGTRLTAQLPLIHRLA